VWNNNLVVGFIRSSIFSFDELRGLEAASDGCVHSFDIQLALARFNPVIPACVRTARPGMTAGLCRIA
jgi:hypothetical protein